jgi:hypothetical protein
VTDSVGLQRATGAPTWRHPARLRTAAVGWFAGQAAATLAWWGLMAVSDRVRRWFELSDDRHVLSSFLIADLVLIAGGSLIAAAALWRRAGWAAWAAMAVAGAVAYATLYLVAWIVNGGDGWLGLVSMWVATLGSGGAAAVAAAQARGAGSRARRP